MFLAFAGSSTEQVIPVTFHFEPLIPNKILSPVMRRIHAILADGTVVRDVEAFERLYEQVGLGWVYAVTKYEPVGTMADVVYGLWAKYCQKLTGGT